MSFNWTQYVSFAKEIIQDDPKAELAEAYSRASVSRSYYGAFGLARKILLERKIQEPKGEIHSHVIKQFQESQNKIDRQIGEQLNRLKAQRVEADYKEDLDFDKDKATTANELASRLLRLYDDPNCKRAQ